MSRIVALWLMVLASSLSAGTWSWDWKAATDEPAPKAEVTTFLYGKDWAYAVEIDDGPKWVREFAVPFLAEHQWTDAPPGVGGGNRKPFVGGVAVIVANVGTNQASVDFDDLNAMVQSGWGVLNHSWSHEGLSWKPEGAMTDEQVKIDAFWSQAILAHGLASGRAPTAAVYANGYVDYNRNGALEEVGVRIATRVSGSSSNDVTGAKLKLMDFNRNYLDEGAWTNNGFRGAVMGGIPNADADGPAKGAFIIDFTHGIDRNAESPNQKRWKERLTTIASRWGAGGKDNVWAAPTDAIGNYIIAAKTAKVEIKAGRLTVLIPDDQPGTPLTIKLTGISAKNLDAPAGGTVYRQNDTVWLTTPMIGKAGAPQPKLRLVYSGPPKDVKFDRPEKVAAVMTDMFGSAPPNSTFAATLHTPTGDQAIPIITYRGGWVVGSRLYAYVPTRPPVEATGISVEAVKHVRVVKVWAIDEEPDAGK